jgi:hypothetical protein
MSSAGPYSASSDSVVVGQGAWRYRADGHWPSLPQGWSFVEVPGVAADSAGNVLVFNRGEHPLIIFDQQGRFIRSWGEGQFVRPHGLTVGPDDAVYCVDDADHTVRKYTPDGRLVWKLGTSGQPSDTGARSVDYRHIRQAAGPFNFPTNLALAPDGEIYIADGYGNARIHRYTSDGQFVSSWGEPGNGAGQFHVPHGIAVDSQKTVYVADRENSRLQLFSPEGKFLDQWTDVARPCQVRIDSRGNVFVAELGFRAGMFAGNQPPPGSSTGGRVSIFDRAGQLQARWGGGDNPCQAGDFYAPHDIWIDPSSDLYVGEVAMSAGGNRGLVPSHCHVLQKFVRLSPQEPACESHTTGSSV